MKKERVPRGREKLERERKEMRERENEEEGSGRKEKRRRWGDFILPREGNMVIWLLLNLTLFLSLKEIRINLQRLLSER